MALDLQHRLEDRQTGEGGDILIIDDPHNPTQIHSYKIRKKVIDWFEQTLLAD